MKNTAGKLINYLNLFVFNNVVYILGVEFVSSYSLGEVVYILEVFITVERIFNGTGFNQRIFNIIDSVFSKGYLLRFLIKLVISYQSLFRVIACLRVLLTLGQMRNKRIDLVEF